MFRRLLLSSAVAVVLAAPACARAATYYVSPSGSDSAAGTSTAAAWRSVTRVDRAALAPGDNVLFEGGVTFTDATLMPPASGAAGAPITFSSYGTGQATFTQGIWFASAHNLVFDDLAVDSAPTVIGLQASASGSGSTDITVRRCTFRHVRIGMMQANPNDTRWTIDGNTIQYTGDSGVISFGHDLTFTNNTILDTGQDSSIAYGKHGVYAKGPNLTFRNNVIRRFSANGLSLRYHGDTVVGNDISDGPVAIGWFQQDTTAGTATIAYNRISGTTSSGIYVSPSDDAGATIESFVIANNTILAAGGNGMDLARTNGSLTLANNAIGGRAAPVFVARGAARGYAEGNDLLWNGAAAPTIAWNGSWLSLAAYQAASGAGARDRVGDPNLDSSFLPPTGSIAIDAGRTSVPGLSYSAACDGKTFSYCGTAPDAGAVEAKTPTYLQQPGGVTVSSTSSSLALTWRPFTDSRVAGVQVFKNGTFVTVATGTSYTLANLVCGTTYRVALRSVSTTGIVSASTAMSVTTAACASGTLAASTSK